MDIDAAEKAETADLKLVEARERQRNVAQVFDKVGHEVSWSLQEHKAVVGDNHGRNKRLELRYG